MTQSKLLQHTVHFSGPPRRIILQSALPEIDETEFKPSKELDSFIEDAPNAFRLKRNREGKISDLKIKLSSSTPPGQYKAELKTEAGRIPIEIHVEEHRRVTLSPPQLTFAGAPGEKVRIRALFINKGNVAFDIPKTSSLGIYDDDGIETAFASTYRKNFENTDEFLGHFIKKVRDGHGGLLKLRIVEGSGALLPDSRSSVIIEAQLPSKLRSMHHYHGVWSTSLFEQAVQVSTTTSKGGKHHDAM